MKKIIAKMIWTIMALVFLSACAPPVKAILSQSDIDIYVNNAELISDTIRKNRKNNKEWEEYFLRIDGFFTYFYLLHEDKPKDLSKLFDELKSEYYKIIDGPVPDELNSVFKEIGWETDGNKKLWTIVRGNTSISYNKQVSNDIAGYIIFAPVFIIVHLFSDNGISGLIEQIRHQAKIASYSKKAMKLFNKNDLELIKENYETVAFAKFHFWIDWY